MKRLSEFAALLALLGLVACGGSGAADKTRSNDKSEDGRITAELPEGGKRTAAANDFLRLSAVRINPADRVANVDLSAEAIVTPPVPEVIEFEYRWFVSNQELANVNGPTLKSGNFRKHQWIFCQVRAKAGKKVSGWLKSDWVRIANSPPHIEPIAVDNFTVPGKLRYQITANDIDNDELTYELIAPLDAGIELDKASGLLTWDITAEIVEKLGETIDVSISVSDNDAKPTIGSFTLRFQKKAAQKSQ